MLSRATLTPSSAERVARGAVDADDGDDVARLGHIDVFALVGVHPDEPSEPHFLAGSLVRVAFALLTILPW